MGCGCNKGRRSGNPGRGIRPIVGPVNQGTSNGPGAGLSPAERRIMAANQAQSLSQSRSNMSERRRIERLRREAIRKSLGK